MIESLKKTFFAGLGATVVTAEKIEKSLQDWVKKGKISAEEARETAERISEESKKEYEEAQSSLKSLFEELLDKAPVVSRKEFDKLAKRVEELEKACSDAADEDS